MAGDTGAEDLGAMVAGIGRKRIVRRADHRRPDRFAVRRIPAADHPVGAAGEQSAAVREKRHRPNRQAGADKRVSELARFPLDERNGAANAGGRNEISVGRNRKGNDGIGRGFNLAERFAGR